MEIDRRFCTAHLKSVIQGLCDNEDYLLAQLRFNSDLRGNDSYSSRSDLNLREHAADLFYHEREAFLLTEKYMHNLWMQRVISDIGQRKEIQDGE